MYRIVGADGRQYGPVSAEQLRRWIWEGRANGQTLALAEGGSEWKPLGALPEFAAQFGAQVPPAISPLTSVGRVRRTSGFATAGLVLGIISCGICCCYGFPFNILGLIFSLVALSEINREPEVYEGRGLAIAGLVLSIASILFYAALLLFALATGHFHAYHYYQFRRF